MTTTLRMFYARALFVLAFFFLMMIIFAAAAFAQDAGAPHKEANERAAGFMRNAFGVDTSLPPNAGCTPKGA